MVVQWEFNVQNPSDVRVEMTQREQFNNDDVDLTEALVREAIQNSLDAKIDNHRVCVHFSVKTLSETETSYLRENISTLKPHLDACGIKISNHKPVQILTIEDFDTVGLTGSLTARDEGNFDNFWRAVGSSKKEGIQGGRWGLGKIVFSSSSLIKVFFGLTIRKNEQQPYLLGQVVLSNHCIVDKYYPTHGFWFDGRTDDHFNFQKPISNWDLIDKFCQNFSLKRSAQSGLSIVVPFVDDSVTEPKIIEAVIGNYYFPIILGDLEVTVGDTIIDSSTLKDINEQATRGVPQDVLEFIRGISSRLDSSPDIQVDASNGDDMAEIFCFQEEEEKFLKQRYSEGALIHARVLFSLKHNNLGTKNGSIDLFLKANQADEARKSLITRGPIILPEESKKFCKSGVLGAMLSRDDSIAEFLGDAENPAHTRWNARSERLKKKWGNYWVVLKQIRASLPVFYNQISVEPETQHDDSLIDFFSLDDTDEGKRPSRKPRQEIPDIPKTDKAIRINSQHGGFIVTSGKSSRSWNLPLLVRVRVAYDTVGGDAFSRYSPFDFDLQDENVFEFECKNAKIMSIVKNEITLEILSKKFSVLVRGFDTRRDIVVAASTL